MQLVADMPAVFSTCQGEGILTGMPSTFVRLWGCDFNCTWCDSKDSWRPGSKSVQCDVDTVAESVFKLKNRHVVITGGNPLLQGEEVRGLTLCLRQSGHHVTLETQGSVYHRAAHAVNLLSLSPKLHDWRDKSLRQFLKRGPGRFDHDEYPDLQFKIVVQTEKDVIEAVRRLNHLEQDAVAAGWKYHEVNRIIQPEWSVGRKWYTEIMRILMERQAAGDTVDSIRVMSQHHKFVGIM